MILLDYRKTLCSRWLCQKRVVKAPDVKRMGCDVRAAKLNLEPLEI